VKVGVFTDLGHAARMLFHYFSQCHAAFLESNYDEDLLEQGSYPYHLKQRIKGDKGHLSNKQALICSRAIGLLILSHLFLSHLRRITIIQAGAEFFAKDAGRTEIVVAGRKKENKIVSYQGWDSG